MRPNKIVDVHQNNHEGTVGITETWNVLIVVTVGELCRVTRCYAESKHLLQKHVFHKLPRQLVIS